jgi:hypothetical protein
LSAIIFAAAILPKRAATLEIRGPARWPRHLIPVAFADFEGERYLVSMLGKNAKTGFAT